MTKVMRYENGKAITGQVDAPFKVDWSEWQTMTDAQKKGKKWLIENVPGAEGEIDAELLVPLWTNPSPTAAFAAQDITLSSSDYDFLLVITRYAANTGYITSSTIVPKGRDVLLNYCLNNVVRNRTMIYVSATKYSVGDGYSNNTTENSVVIPQYIYGFKKSVKIKFDALAKDVSTLASKCMLEDGETSVEDVIPSKSQWVDITSQCTINSIYNHNLKVSDNGQEYLITGAAKAIPTNSGVTIITFPKNLDLGSGGGYVTCIGDNGNGQPNAGMLARFGFGHNTNTLGAHSTSASGYYGVYIRIKHF